jgi:hypothetical protein
MENTLNMEQRHVDNAHAESDVMAGRIARRGWAGMDLVTSVRSLYAHDRHREGLPTLTECTLAQQVEYYTELRTRLQAAADESGMAY